MMKKLKTPLSSKLHVAIRQAVEDVMECRKDDRYRINMHVWHVKRADSGWCEVCLAGAAIARRTETPPHKSRFELIVQGVNMADVLESVRTGEVSYFCRLLSLRVPRNIPNYVSNPVQYPEDDNEADVQKWRANMLRIADWIESNTVPCAKES